MSIMKAIEMRKHYALAALFSSNDDDGVPLNNEHGLEDIDPGSWGKMLIDCQEFIDAHEDDLYTWDAGRTTATEQAGHDLWLTRNGHGAGFWESEWGDVGEQLSEAAKAMGEINLYIGDDGLIYSLQ